MLESRAHKKRGHDVESCLFVFTAGDGDSHDGLLFTPQALKEICCNREWVHSLEQPPKVGKTPNPET